MNPEIDELWKNHYSKKFPRGYGGEEIDGIDLALLDAETAGCISTYINHEGELDRWRIAILGKNYRDLSYVINKLDEPGKDYFSFLEKLAGLVLQDIILSTNQY